MGNLCIIPARGGSKRIPRKNVKEFLGKPILAYAIETALKVGLFDEVMVSTDDDQIADIARSYGASVPFMRSEKNADDFASTFDVIKEVLMEYKQRGQVFSNGCCLYPCTPLAGGEKLKEASLKLHQFETVISVVEYEHPIQRAFKIDKTDKITYLHPHYSKARTQDLEPSYHDAGQFYWFQIKALLANNSLVSKKVGAILLSKIEAQDIDTYTDWQLAELKYKLLHGIS